MSADVGVERELMAAVHRLARLEEEHRDHRGATAHVSVVTARMHVMRARSRIEQAERLQALAEQRDEGRRR